MKIAKSLGGLLAITMLVSTPTLAEAKRSDRGSHHRDDKKKNTLIGAGLGLLGGAILSGGDPWASVAGAAAGGAIGNVTTDDRNGRNRDRNRNNRDWDRRDSRNRPYR